MAWRPGALSLSIGKPEEVEENARKLAERQKLILRPEVSEACIRLRDGREAYIIASPPQTLTITSNTILYLDQYPPGIIDPHQLVSEPSSPGHLAKILMNSEGFFSGVLIRKDGALIFRDHVGAIPISCSVKPGILQASTLSPTLPEGRQPPPGRILHWNSGPVRIIRWHHPKPQKPENPERALAQALKSTAEEYLPDRFALSFSGGFDSSLLTHIAIKVGKKPTCITLGTPNSIDLRWAEEAASILGVNLTKIELNRESIGRVLKTLRPFLLKTNPMDLALATIFYIAARACGDNILAVGQGADELFGGYWKYERLADEYGVERAQGEMMRDIHLLHRSNLKRDWTACALAGSRLLTPYLSRRIYELALQIPPQLKLGARHARVRKLILREAARILELPEKLRIRPKKAAQYGSGVQRMVEKLAKESF